MKKIITQKTRDNETTWYLENKRVKKIEKVFNVWPVVEDDEDITVINFLAL